MDIVQRHYARRKDVHFFIRGEGGETETDRQTDRQTGRQAGRSYPSCGVYLLGLFHGLIIEVTKELGVDSLARGEICPTVLN